MAAEFVALADFLRPAARHDGDTSAPLPAVVVEAPEMRDRDVEPDTVRDVLRDARLFRARLADAFEEAAARLLRELAADVLARELRLAPCDLAVIVQRAAERAPVVRVRVAPGEIASVTGAPLSRGGEISVGDVPVVADSALEPGDAIVELDGGALDVRLGVRLAAVLEAFA